MERGAWRGTNPPTKAFQCDIHNLESSLYNARLKSRGGLPLSKTSLIPIERIEKAIYLIRGEKVMLDRDLARLYDVTTAAR